MLLHPINTWWSGLSGLPHLYKRILLDKLVEPTGLLNGTSFIISDDPGAYYREYPDLAYNRHANRYMVVWQQWDDAASTWDIYGQQVHGGGGLYLTPITIAYYTAYTVLPRIASIPTTPSTYKFLVVFEAHYTPTDYDIYLRLIEEEGGMPEDQTIANTNANECNPNVIGSENGMKYLVTWEQYVEDDYGYGPVGGNGTVGREVSYESSSWGSLKMIGTVYSSSATLAAGSSGDFLAVFMQSGIADGLWGQLWGLRTYLPIIMR